MMGRPTARTAKQMADAFLQDRVGLQADRVLVSLGFQELIEVRHGEGCVAPEESPLHGRATVTLDDRLKDRAPVVGAGHVAGAQGGALQVAELVEQEKG